MSSFNHCIVRSVPLMERYREFMFDVRFVSSNGNTRNDVFYRPSELQKLQTEMLDSISKGE